MNRNIFRRAVSYSIIAAALALSSPLQAQETAGAAVSIFNSKDLTGWKTPSPNPFWKVADGMIIGENDAAKKGGMLYTEKSYGDFEFEGEARWSGEIDSGFMFRKPELQLQIGVSRSLKKDMTGCFYTGGEEKYPVSGQAVDRAKLIKPDQWNHFRIRAQGGIFTVWINGTEAVTYKNEKYAGAAPVGLQIHPGLDMKVEVRALKIKELK